MVGLYIEGGGVGVILGGGGGLYVYGSCLIAMGFEWFESDIFGLAKYFSLVCHEFILTINITTL